MAKWHFYATRCSNRHVMMGVLWSEDETNLDRVAAGVLAAREEGERSGALKGRCGQCGVDQLLHEDLDTGCDDETAAAAWVQDKIQRWRSDHQRN